MLTDNTMIKNIPNKRPIDLIIRPFQQFVNAEVSSGIVLIFIVLLATTTPSA